MSIFFYEKTAKTRWRLGAASFKKEKLPTPRVGLWAFAPAFPFLVVQDAVAVFSC